MAAVDDLKTLGRTRLSFASEAEIDEFVATLELFEKGELTPDEWRAYRLVRGTYSQSQDGDVHMLRVKIPQGVLDAEELRALADVAQTYSRGFGHITTRQNMQFHFMKLHDVEPAMRRLAEAGLTTREACGNSVRNITGCPYAGVAADEAFDVTPYAEVLTRHLLRHPLSSSLPRKFKIAFEGCPEEHTFTAINDLGFRARFAVENGVTRFGFRVTAGGGTSTKATSGGLLFEFLPAGEILAAAEAVVRVFHRLGNRKDKAKARMKFLIAELGWEAWKKELENAFEEVKREGNLRLPFDPDRPPVEVELDGPRRAAPDPASIAAEVVATPVRGPGLLPSREPVLPSTERDFLLWKETNVRAQKQAGYSLVTATIPLGDLMGSQLRILGKLAESFGDGTVRITPDQDLLFRWVRATDVPSLFVRLSAAGLGLPGASTISDVTSCPGSESCRLAVTQSRGLGKLLGDLLSEREDLAALAPDLKLKISGCPNGCGHHHIAGIGFQGSARKVDGKTLPQYFVMVGGAVDHEGAAFARLAAKIPVRRLTLALERLLGLYAAERAEGESATAFFRRIELARVKALLADLGKLAPGEASPGDFIDVGEEADFRVQTKEGECAA
jgi:sulfite reductase (NADPH) hemoprotein beta-component